MKMFLICFFFIVIFGHGVANEDVCQMVNCGSGICKTTLNPTLPYYCQCSNGSNTILPCPSENPCSHNPCGQGTCEVVPKLLYGYLCRCAGDRISLTSCNAIPRACASNPCMNGICIEGLTSFICNCLPTWTGRTCNEKIDSSCTNNLCGVGKCFSINDPSFPHICLCPNGQFAMSCWSVKQPTIATTIITTMTTTTAARMLVPEVCNPLNKQSCMHGGQCLPTMNGYQCLCTSGFTGSSCEIKINECASNPCLHGGVCYDLQSSYICGCPDGTFRSQCLPKMMTASSTARTLTCPCKNGGSCSLFGFPICTCSEGFTGRFCEIPLVINNCERVQCMNGGSCYQNASETNSPNCLCKAGYTGQYCEIEYFQCHANGRFMDRYNCAAGKYFECIHHGQGGLLLSRSCPPTLRFNILIDGCDHANNVQCLMN